MDPKEKIVVVVMSVIGVTALTLGFTQFRKNLGAPLLDYKPMSIERQQKLLANIQGDIGSNIDLANLKNQDSDNDGLSDYDEVYIYHTSPYLADSDADGFSDQEEITSGNDPLCPTGKVCEKEITQGININSTSDVGSEADINTNSGLSLGSSGLPGTPTADLSPETLRQYLKQAGATDEMLVKIDDATLLKLYQDALSQTNAVADTSSLGSADSVSGAAPVSDADAKAAFLTTIANMTPTEMRNYLKQSGAPAATVDSVDDATLKKMFMEAAANQVK